MIATFHVTTLFGSGDPRLMAGGISEALSTTMLGLCVAIPIMLAHTFLSRWVDHIGEDMEEKAVGLSNIIMRDGHYEKLAHAYLAGHKSDLALQSLDKAIAIAPEARLYQLKGQIVMASEQRQKAHLTFGKATMLDTKKRIRPFACQLLYSAGRQL